MHIATCSARSTRWKNWCGCPSEPLGVEDRPGAAPIAHRARRRSRSSTSASVTAGTPRRCIEDFSWCASVPGERVGLVGHSGSGKTTFVKLIQRLYDVTRRPDHDRWAGHRAGHVRRRCARQIAIVQQEPVLFHRSLAENIAYARPGAAQAEIERAARLANAHDFIARLPRGYADAGRRARGQAFGRRASARRDWRAPSWRTRRS